MANLKFLKWIEKKKVEFTLSRIVIEWIYTNEITNKKKSFLIMISNWLDFIIKSRLMSMKSLDFIRIVLQFSLYWSAIQMAGSLLKKWKIDKKKMFHHLSNLVAFRIYYFHIMKSSVLKTSTRTHTHIYTFTITWKWLWLHGI